jgi:N6-L-threonylcarbamoyladenine synthase
MAMRILAIETSCDDTSMAVVEITEPKNKVGLRQAQPIPEFLVLKNIVSSQTDIHRHWGGVVPSLAKREHLKNLPLIWKEISPTLILPLSPKEGGNQRDFPPPRGGGGGSSLDLIAVTVGPGLEPSLWTGIEFAKKLSAELNVPLVGANHLEGHLYSNLLTQIGKLPITNYQLPKFPAIVLLVSGGHTMLVLMKNLKTWQKLGETRDDAVGEAFDKVAKMTGLPYPGGPEIEKLAASGNPEAIKFPRPMIHEKNYDFSFSGLKTAVLYYLKDKILSANNESFTNKRINEKSKLDNSDIRTNSLFVDVAASFQTAAIDVLVTKTFRAVEEFGAKSVFLCGGVAANKALRATLQSTAENAGVQFFAPAPEYNTDNAAMIAAAAYMRLKSRKKKYPIEADSNLTL